MSHTRGGRGVSIFALNWWPVSESSQSLVAAAAAAAAAGAGAAGSGVACAAASAGGDGVPWEVVKYR